MGHNCEDDPGHLSSSLETGKDIISFGSRINQSAKEILKKLRLYDLAHHLWEKRPEWRSSCLNLGYRICKAPDGLPIPNSRLLYAVALSREAAWYLHGGRLCCNAIRYALSKNDYGPEGFETILDFGCGCGRVIRHWSGVAKGPRLYGTDINPDLISWDRKHLSKIADFQINRLEPPLNYPEAFFSFIYTISVFTHLTEAFQNAWIDELRRVLKPNGLLLITVHGQSRLDQLSNEERGQFKAGNLVVRNFESPGSNVCGAYHPETYVRNCLASRFEVIDFIPRGIPDADQDIYLLKKAD
jgi:SAM-dependent methyltransferase